MKRTNGFTLIELIVVIAVISILSSIVFFNISQASKKSRDGDRLGDLRTLQAAIELYKQKNGRYPAGCNGPNQWSGQVGTSYVCNRNNGIYAQYVGTGQFIIGHATGFNFAPTFIPSLPSDKKLNGQTSGYVYTTDQDGTVYKLMAKQTVESETVTITHPFKSCDVTDSSTGICDNTSSANGWGGNPPNQCQPTNVAQFQKSYAVWGGFPYEPNASIPSRSEEMLERIVCMP